MNIKGDVSFQISVFISFGYNSRSGIAGSHDTSVFNILRTIYTVFHSGYINLYSISVLGFPFLHILVNNYLLSFLLTYLFIYCYFDRGEVISHCDFIFYRLILLIYLWLGWVFFVVACQFPPVATSGGYSPVLVQGLLIEVASLIVEHGL